MKHKALVLLLTVLACQSAYAGEDQRGEESDEDEAVRGSGQRAAFASAEMMARAAMIGLTVAALT